MIALGVLTTGVLGAAAVLATGMQNLSSSPGDVIVDAEGGAGIEAVFSARDSHKLTWAQIRNVNGARDDGGVFLDGPQPLKLAGADGLVNTVRRHDAVETVTAARARTGCSEHGDDQVSTLSSYTRRDHDYATCRTRTATSAIDRRDDHLPERRDDAHLHADDVHLVVLIEGFRAQDQARKTASRSPNCSSPPPSCCW